MLILKEVRKSLGLTRYQLSKKSGIRQSTIQNIENSENPNATFTTLCKLADSMGVTLNDLRKKK